MRIMKITFMLASIALFSTSCLVSKKKYTALQSELETTKKQKTDLEGKVFSCENTVNRLTNDNVNLNSTIVGREAHIVDLKSQLEDCKAIRDKQLTAVGDLTVLTQAANDNIKESLAQLERKDKYIHLLQAAKSKADSLNLALAINLKGVLKEGLDDKTNDNENSLNETFRRLLDLDISHETNLTLLKLFLMSNI